MISTGCCGVKKTEADEPALLDTDDGDDGKLDGLETILDGKLDGLDSPLDSPLDRGLDGLLAPDESDEKAELS